MKRPGYNRETIEYSSRSEWLIFSRNEAAEVSTSGRITFFTSKHGINSFLWWMGGVVLQLWFPRSDLEQPYNDTKRPLRLQFEVRPSTSSTEFSQNLTSDSLLICVFCTGCEPEIILPVLQSINKNNLKFATCAKHVNQWRTHRQILA